MRISEISINSACNEESGDFQRWVVPNSFRSFSTQLLRAAKEADPEFDGFAELSLESLEHLEQNWDYAFQEVPEYWLKSLIYNVRSQVWCDNYASDDSGIESHAREKAIKAVGVLHESYARHNDLELKKSLYRILFHGIVPEEWQSLQFSGLVLQTTTGVCLENYASHLFNLLIKNNPDEALELLGKLITKKYSEGINAQILEGMISGGLQEHLKTQSGIHPGKLLSLAEEAQNNPSQRSAEASTLGYICGIALSVCEEKPEVWNEALERIESICSKSSDSRRFLMAFSAPISDKYEKTGYREPFQSHLLEFFKRSEPEIYEWFARRLGRETGL